MRELGYGAGYKYAHAYVDAYAPQEYLPEVLRGAVWYVPYRVRLREDCQGADGVVGGTEEEGDGRREATEWGWTNELVPSVRLTFRRTVFPSPCWYW